MSDISKSVAVKFKPKFSRNDDPVSRSLYAELTKFSVLLAHHGIDVEIDSPKAIAAWAARTNAEKLGIVDAFSKYRRICTEMHLAGVSLRDNNALLAHSLKRNELLSREDLTCFVTNDNMVEVYSLDNVQIFRSINFFDYCNYSLLDLLTREWPDLYERLSSVTDDLMHQIQTAVGVGELRKFTTPTHVMKERDSNPRGVFQIDHQYVCPLYDSQGKVTAFMANLNVRELDVLGPDEDRFDFLR